MIAVPLPDPGTVRGASRYELGRLGVPLPPDEYPLVWETGDEVALRSTAELESRAAILHVIMARCFGMPADAAMGWLLGSHLVEQVTPPEWQFLVAGKGDHRSFVLHHDALFGLAWVLGLTRHLDPTVPPDDAFMRQLPDLAGGETFAQWRSRILAAPRDPVEVASLLDLHYCLDWSYLEIERLQGALPGLVDANAIGQRRWALEWAVVFSGPYHDSGGGWEEVDLST